MLAPMTDAPPDLARWSLHCFCLRARSNPKGVIGLDNNGQVLFHLIGAGRHLRDDVGGVRDVLERRFPPQHQLFDREILVPDPAHDF